MVGVRAAAVRHRAAGGRPGHHRVRRRFRRAVVDAQPAAVRAAVEDRSATVHCGLCGTALPHQLQLPRRCQPAGGAGRGGLPAEPEGARGHRPRRVLRCRPVLRSRPGTGPADHLRCRAVAGPARAAERRTRPGRPAPSGTRPGAGRVQPAVPGHLAGPARRRGEGPAGLRPRRGRQDLGRPCARPDRLPEGPRTGGAARGRHRGRRTGTGQARHAVRGGQRGGRADPARVPGRRRAQRRARRACPPAPPADGGHRKRALRPAG